jgi:hypothetical protein
MAAEAYPQPGSSEAQRSSIVDHPVVYWGLALFFLLIFLRIEVAIFFELSDLGTLAADNGLRLQQVRDLLAGQGWFDTHQYRYLPPQGTLMHWSRLVDAPIAAAILLLTPITGQAGAEIAVATGWPILLLAVYLALAVWALMQIAGMRAAALAVVVAVTLLPFRDLFGVGELDHHNVQAILTFTSALSFAFVPSRPLAPIVSGVCAALSLAVGLESLPFIAAIGAVYCLYWVFDARQARAFLLFAAALSLASLVAFAAQTAPALWLTPFCDILAMPLLTLIWGGLAASAALVTLGRRLATWQMRLAAAAVAGGAVVGLCAAAFPICLGGPYHAVPESVRAEWLGSIGEALSFVQMAKDNPMMAFMVLGPPLVAAAAAWLGVMRTEGECRRLLLIVAALLSLTVALCLVQLRAVFVGCGFVPVAAGWALDRILTAVTRQSRITLRALALLVAGIFFFDAAWASVVGFAERLNLVPPQTYNREELRACRRDTSKLNVLPPSVIFAPLDLGAHILFLTHHSIISAGYHRNVEGILAQFEGLAGSQADVLDFVRRDGAEYLVLCPLWIDYYPDRYGPFAKGLVDGASVPWLEPVPLDGSLKVWRVKRDRLPPAS